MDPSDQVLRRDLSTRQVSMLALGGTIGAGLFVGSGAVVSTAGPAALLSYAVGGVVVVLAMRMIAEMAVVQPSAGSLADWPRVAIGPWAGFVTGWLYWYSWIVVIAFEAVAGGVVLQQWIDAPLAALSAATLLLVLGLNATSVRRFGEAEYWLSAVKVVAIVAFLAVCLLAVAGLWPGREAGAPGLAGQPLAPGGALAVLTGLLAVLFSYAGTEIVAVAAAETEEPARSLRRATRSVVVRILLFYIGSITAVVLLLPTADTPADSSPFAAVLDALGLPLAGTVLDVVIVCALLSAMNSALYTSSRILFGLARAGDAGRRYGRLDARGVPRRALVLSGALSGAGIVVAVVSPDTAFLVLLGAASSVLVPLYLLLAFAQLRLRRRWEVQDPGRLTVRMWWFPYGTYALIAIVLAITVALFALPDFLPQAVLTGLAVLVTCGAYLIRRRYGPPASPPRGRPEVPATALRRPAVHEQGPR